MKQWLAIGAVLLSLSVLKVRGSSYYQVIDLGDLGGGVTQAFGINSNGQVVGMSYAGDNHPYPFLYSNGSLLNLGTLGGASGYAYGINANGQMVGRSFTTNGLEHAFFYSNGAMQDVATMGGSYSSAQGINDSGQIVGMSYTGGDLTEHAFMYSNRVMQDLGVLDPGYNYSQAFAINASGQTVGMSYASNGSVHGFLYSGGAMKDIGTLGGNTSYANGINDRGLVVGVSSTYDSLEHVNGPNHAFVYSNGLLSDLGTLGGNISYANSINNGGQVVGYAQTSTGVQDAFVYSNGSMKDLNSLIDTNSGWTLQNATGINDSGQIVGWGYNSAGQFHSFLLNPSAPIITTQPKSQTIAIGSTVCLGVRALDAPLSYQWFFGANAIAGATNGWLVLTNVQSSQAGVYTVAVANQWGTTTSNPAMLDVLPGLGITMIPGISVSGTIGLTYQLEYVNAFGPTNAWQLLATITVTNNPQWYFDVSAVGQPARFYQLVQVP